tara:strand:- start:47228 stop:47695 length:468 start_codon:yes stop_codon:yes gene_type:complete
MFGDPRSAILSDIHNYTIETVGPFTSGGVLSAPGVTSDFGRFKDEEGGDTMYLMLSHKDRVLFYGMDLDPPSESDIAAVLQSAGLDEPEEVEASSRITLFCRRGDKQTAADIRAFFSRGSDDAIECLDHIQPAENDSNEDFFLKNAMWLLNPMVH